MKDRSRFKHYLFLSLLFIITLNHSAGAQSQGDGSVVLELKDLSAFKSNAANWKIAGGVTASLTKQRVMKSKPGTGVLVNLPDKKNYSNLLSTFEHGDMDLELEFMMTAHSNSGIYLQGRYEVQLLDSWGVKKPRYGDCGGIYQRRRKDGSQFEGHAPIMNACRAPGLWQKMRISFQAPKFDVNGKKIANAKILQVVLNGVIIQDNVELTGPTGGPISQEEAAFGPLMIQGDHGPVAFRNIKYISFDKKAPSLSDLSYKLYTSEIPRLINYDFEGIAHEMGTLSNLTWEVTPGNHNYALVIKGKIEINDPGDYKFYIQAGGNSSLKVDGENVIGKRWTQTFSPARGGAVSLSQGSHDLEIVYGNFDSWLPSGLGVWIEGPGIRRSPLHAKSSLSIQRVINPILVNAPEPTILRSFVDYFEDEDSKAQTMTHAINVGGPDQIHFTYNPGAGNMVHVWKGRFLDATPMWSSRGNGKSVPLGSKLNLENEPVVARLAGMNEQWPKSGDKTQYIPKGYEINQTGYPVFKYVLNGSEIRDDIQIKEGKYLTRQLNFNQSGNQQYVRLAKGKQIELLEKNLYNIDDLTYYVKIEETAGAKPIIRNIEGGQELLLPVQGTKVRYSLIW
ncbi:DUF1080 domain-containing protein [Fulvivirgaceae bacterium BMA10]|uniref:DUF1080 domain-containing protein n=1 Tax=Splendidivirga corallicola TaxID=3051826 RepID=A0ABT8KVA2_9BACT|nr:DUF1080 domain-containing protein [Fulvivirgaceae bacterium BMA10]